MFFSLKKMNCKDCKSYDLVQCISDVTCRNCGLEQNIGNMMNENNVTERVGDYNSDLKTCIGGSLYTALQRTFKKVNNEQTITDDFSNVHELLNISCSELISTSQKMYRDYTKKKIIKTHNRRLATYLAAISICTNKSIYVIKDIFRINITKFVDDMKLTLKDSSSWQNVNVETKQEAIWKQLASISTFLPKDKINIFRRVAFQIYEKINQNPESFNSIQSCHEKGKNGACMYIAKDHLKIGLKLKDIAFACDATCVNILNIVRKIRASKFLLSEYNI